jgi:ketosteroid isomerase-like protein
MVAFGTCQGRLATPVSMWGMADLPDRASGSLADADAMIRVAERYVGAYQDRDLSAMLAVMDENVVSYPAPLFGHRPHVGHAGVREWWAAMMARKETYDVVVSQVRQLDSGRVVVLGELHSDGRRLSPWAVVVRMRGGLIVESRSYLSDEKVLDDLKAAEGSGDPDPTAPR